MTGNPSPLEQLNAACRGFRDTLPRLIRSMDDNGTTTSKDVVKALCLLKDVKQSTRETFLDAEVYRRRVAEQKDLVEAHHLKLQNLLYEKDNLLREIKRCRGFPTKELDKIEFKDGVLPVLVDDDRHKRHLQRLDDELSDRKALLQHQQHLKTQISSVEDATQSKHALLDALPAHLAAIEEASRPLQALLSVPISDSRDRHQAAKALPTPLYLLFCELDAYLSIHAGSGAVGIADSKAGPLSKLKLKSTRGKEGPDAATPDDADSATPPPPKRPKTSTTDHDAFIPSPQSVVLQLGLPDKPTSTTKVVFQYLPRLGVVVVDSPRFPTLLRRLFATDSGLQTPPGVSYAFKTADGAEVPMEFPADVKARPYVWAQWISGLTSVGHRLEPSVRHVMARVYTPTTPAIHCVMIDMPL
ncbi:hypothetical protein, variant 2 [Aphanomyces astaci]|uniref:THO complex subunit 5 n=1 Tax=Aphanomyces astaci TaxID=112090 RepID=W4FPC7_APHAT|nr:hypothetical protein, variant 2 [Aphanomyces astaci]ETV69347.1 hypothetical protein, variant 2 [Aphanomyces astaci]|eukprot:XP_009841204.1 hypothetical protein, variant 2 [Aphanomyces astaci]